MHKNRETSKYAKALHSISKESQCIEETIKNLQSLSSIYSSSSEFRLFLYSKRILAKKKVEILHKVLLNEFSSLELDLLNQLIENDNINLLKPIIKQFINICNQDQNMIKVILTTAKELNSEEKRDVRNAIEKKLNKKVNLDNVSDASIIGGAKFRIENIIVDGSISSRLEKLEKSFYER